MEGTGKENIYVQDWELLLKCHLHLQSIDEEFRITETASSCHVDNYLVAWLARNINDIYLNIVPL